MPFNGLNLLQCRGWKVKFMVVEMFREMWVALEEAEEAGICAGAEGDDLDLLSCRWWRWVLK